MTDTGLSWFGSQYLNRSHEHALMPAGGGYFTSLILMQIFDFSRRFFSKMLIGFTLSSLDLLVLQISSGAHLKGLNPVIVVVYKYLKKY